MRSYKEHHLKLSSLTEYMVKELYIGEPYEPLFVVSATLLDCRDVGRCFVMGGGAPVCHGNDASHMKRGNCTISQIAQKLM